MENRKKEYEVLNEEKETEMLRKRLRSELTKKIQKSTEKEIERRNNGGVREERGEKIGIQKRERTMN